ESWNLMVMLTEFIPPVLIVAVSIIASLAAWLASKKLLSTIPLPKIVQDSILLVVRSPVAVAITGFGLTEAVRFIDNLSPTLIPFFLKPDVISLVVQLVVLVLALRVVNLGVKRLSAIVEARLVGRTLNVAIYVVGLIAISSLVLASPLTPRVTANVQAGIAFITGLLVTYLAVFILDVIIKRYVHPIVVKEPRLATMYTFFRRLLVAIVAVVGVSAAAFSAFPEAGAALTSMVIAAGFMSIVIGLAAQSSLSNLVSGILISMAQPFKIGEAVVFRNDFCFVEDVKLVHTVLRTWDNRRLIVPNSLFQSEVIINYSSEDPTMLAPVFVQISYESDLDKAMKVMREVALSHPNCMPIGDLPNVVVMEFADSGINLRLLSRAKDQPTAFMMARDLLYKIKKEFDANGIEIPYPRRYLVLGKETARVLGRVAGGPDPRAEDEEKG
ncbi:MAG: mechanosensitive ion channel family protein, partial [Candidatus Bathyarchaeia archaeon]